MKRGEGKIEGQMEMGREDDPIFLLDTKKFNRETIARGYTAGETALMRKMRRTLRNRHYKRASRAQKKAKDLHEDCNWRQWKVLTKLADKKK